MRADFSGIPVQAPEPILSGGDERGSRELSTSAGQNLLDPAAGVFHTCQTTSQKAVCYLATTLTQIINNVKLARQQTAEKHRRARWAPARADGRALAYIEGKNVPEHTWQGQA